MKAICRNCHFLSKEYREANTGRTLAFALTEVEREKLAEGLEQELFKHYSLACHMGVWDEGVINDKTDRNSTINLKVRESSCFFFPYHPAMLFDAAKELQKRHDENRQLKNSNFYTRVALYIAAAALAFDAIVECLKQA